MTTRANQGDCLPRGWQMEPGYGAGASPEYTPVDAEVLGPWDDEFYAMLGIMVMVI